MASSSLPFMRDAIIQRNALLQEALPSVPFPLRDARKRFGFGLAMDHCKWFLGLRAVRILDWNDASIMPFDEPPLSNLKIAERLRECRENNGIKQHYMAMYTSIFSGITTDPASMVNRGEGQFADKECGTSHTASVMNGFPYELENQYFDLLSSDLLTGCIMPVKVIMPLIWMKSMEFAMMKTILTALFKMEAEENQAFAGIWSEGEQYVDNRIKMNSQALIFMSRELLLSNFENILSCCTTKLSALVAQLGGINPVNTSLEARNNAGELMLMGNRIPRDPVLQSENHDTITEGEDVAMARSEYDVEYDDDCEDDDDDDCEDDDDDDEECDDDDDDDEEDDDDCEDDDDDDDDDDDECECEDEDDDDDDDEEDCVSLVPEWLYKLDWNQNKSSLVHSVAPSSK